MSPIIRTPVVRLALSVLRIVLPFWIAFHLRPLVPLGPHYSDLVYFWLYLLAWAVCSYLARGPIVLLAPIWVFICSLPVFGFDLLFAVFNGTLVRVFTGDRSVGILYFPIWAATALVGRGVPWFTVVYAGVCWMVFVKLPAWMYLDLEDWISFRLHARVPLWVGSIGGSVVLLVGEVVLPFGGVFRIVEIVGGFVGVLLVWKLGGGAVGLAAKGGRVFRAMHRRPGRPPSLRLVADGPVSREARPAVSVPPVDQGGGGSPPSSSADVVTPSEPSGSDAGPVVAAADFPSAENSGPDGDCVPGRPADPSDRDKAVTAFASGLGPAASYDRDHEMHQPEEIVISDSVRGRLSQFVEIVRVSANAVEPQMSAYVVGEVCSWWSSVRQEPVSERDDQDGILELQREDAAVSLAYAYRVPAIAILMDGFVRAGYVEDRVLREIRELPRGEFAIPDAVSSYAGNHLAPDDSTLHRIALKRQAEADDGALLQNRPEPVARPQGDVFPGASGGSDLAHAFPSDDLVLPGERDADPGMVPVVAESARVATGGYDSVYEELGLSEDYISDRIDVDLPTSVADGDVFGMPSERSQPSSGSFDSGFPGDDGEGVEQAAHLAMGSAVPVFPDRQSLSRSIEVAVAPVLLRGAIQTWDADRIGRFVSEHSDSFMRPDMTEFPQALARALLSAEESEESATKACEWIARAVERGLPGAASAPPADIYSFLMAVIDRDSGDPAAGETTGRRLGRCFYFVACGEWRRSLMRRADEAAQGVVVDGVRDARILVEIGEALKALSPGGSEGNEFGPRLRRCLTEIAGRGGFDPASKRVPSSAVSDSRDSAGRIWAQRLSPDARRSLDDLVLLSETMDRVQSLVSSDCLTRGINQSDTPYIMIRHDLLVLATELWSRLEDGVRRLCSDGKDAELLGVARMAEIIAGPAVMAMVAEALQQKAEVLQVSMEMTTSRSQVLHAEVAVEEARADVLRMSRELRPPFEEAVRRIWSKVEESPCRAIVERVEMETANSDEVIEDRAIVPLSSVTLGDDFEVLSLRTGQGSHQQVFLLVPIMGSGLSWSPEGDVLCPTGKRWMQVDVASMLRAFAGEITAMNVVDVKFLLVRGKVDVRHEKLALASSRASGYVAADQPKWWYGAFLYPEHLVNRSTPVLVRVGGVGATEFWKRAETADEAKDAF